MGVNRLQYSIGNCAMRLNSVEPPTANAEALRRTLVLKRHTIHKGNADLLMVSVSSRNAYARVNAESEGVSMLRPDLSLSLLLVASSSLIAQPKIIAVVNAASFQPGLPAGGALATAYVTGLSGLKPGTYAASSSQAVPQLLGGIGVLVNQTSSAILAVNIPADPSATIQVNFQVPSERNAEIPGSDTFAGSALSVTSKISIATMTGLPGPASGGFFSDTNGYAAALHASDLSPVTVQNRRILANRLSPTRTTFSSLGHPRRLG